MFYSTAESATQAYGSANDSVSEMTYTVFSGTLNSTIPHLPMTAQRSIVYNCSYGAF